MSFSQHIFFWTWGNTTEIAFLMFPGVPTPQGTRGRECFGSGVMRAARSSINERDQVFILRCSIVRHECSMCRLKMSAFRRWRCWRWVQSVDVEVEMSEIPSKEETMLQRNWRRRRQRTRQGVRKNLVKSRHFVLNMATGYVVSFRINWTMAKFSSFLQYKRKKGDPGMPKDIAEWCQKCVK